MDVQLLVTFQLSWALRGLWVCVFHAGTDSDNTLLHISESMDALEAVIPLMIADIAVFDVLKEFADYLTLSSNLAGIATSTLLP